MLLTNNIFIGFGSNLGNRRKNIELAIKKISEVDQLNIIRISSIYETEPIGPIEQNFFLNGVMELETSLEPHALLECLKAIEKKVGRTENVRWGPRKIDLDILLYSDRQIRTPTLTIPHPEMHKRNFVLEPLAEIMADRRFTTSSLVSLRKLREDRSK